MTADEIVRIVGLCVDHELARRWQDGVWAKPKNHGMDHTGLGADDFVQPDRTMSAIGG